MKVKNYQELIVWQKAMDLVEDVYKSSKDFPREEIYGLTSQVRRAAVSIPSTLRKVREEGRRWTFFVICQLLTVRCAKSRRKSRLRGD
jgi:hypothetical protein